MIVLFAAVLALNGADASTIGAIAPQLESSLHINNADVGLLSSVSLLVGAVFTIPVGLLVDRTRRMPLLALEHRPLEPRLAPQRVRRQLLSLLLTRLALGAVAASAGPAIASLTGDYFAADERGRIWSYILVGEAAGTAFGFIISGFMASLIDWRAAFVVLAHPGVLPRPRARRTVPEPLRGGQSHLEVGAVDLGLGGPGAASERADRGRAPGSRSCKPPVHQAAGRPLAAPAPLPNPALVLHEDPRQCGSGGRFATSSRFRPTC